MTDKRQILLVAVSIVLVCPGCQNSKPESVKTASTAPAVSSDTPKPSGTTKTVAVPGPSKTEKSGESVIDAQNISDLRKAVGKAVQITGVAQNSKASAMLMPDAGGEIFCQVQPTHWADELVGQRITVTGQPFVAKTPVFPTATKDKNGQWSQGIAVPEMPTITRGKDGQVTVTRTPINTVGQLILKVTSHRLAN